MGNTQKIISIPEGKICDFIDGTFRKDTPEEYVSQTLEKRLVNEHKYAKSRIRVEYPVKVGDAKKRVDLAVWDASDTEKAQQGIRLIVECKEQKIKPSHAKEGVGQLKSYMAACANCEWGMWTNSETKFVFRKVKGPEGNYVFEEFIDIPPADGTPTDVDRPTRNKLRDASDDNLLFVFRTCHDYIHVTDGLQEEEAFFEFLKIIFCKIEDEHNVPKPLEFFATNAERGSTDGQLTVRNRITSIFKRVKALPKYRRIFSQSDEIGLKPRSLAHVVAELQNYSLLRTNIDVKGKAYEEIVGTTTRGDRGAYFTPRNVMHMVVEMLHPEPGERVLDSSCGTGGFVVAAMTHATRGLESEFAREYGLRNTWPADVEKLFQDQIATLAQSDYFGFDINPHLVKATKMNMVMNNDGSGNILHTDSLLPPHGWDADFRDALCTALGLEKNALRSWRDLALFDVIVTNPPFGANLKISDHATLEQFDLARIWREDKATGHWTKTDKYQSSVPPEILFVERCTQFLKEGGRMGIVLPDNILGAPGLGYVREWIVAHHRIIASIDLHADTFQPHNGTQTSVLILQKKPQRQIDEEEKSGQMADYPIFMAMVERVGHDKRGNPVFRLDADGNKILVEAPDPDAAPGATRKTSILDDQTTAVPGLFEKWKKQEGIPW